MGRDKSQHDLTTQRLDKNLNPLKIEKLLAGYQIYSILFISILWYKLIFYNILTLRFAGLLIMAYAYAIGHSNRF